MPSPPLSDARAKSFDGLADLYERVRPGYPDAIFDRMIAFAALGSGARLLEVGTGTGKATLSFARRGFRILGLEPGANMAAIARANLAQFREVEIKTISFEDWAVEQGAFDLAFVAQAFHWLSPEHRIAKFAQALRRSGTLAIFGNTSVVKAVAMEEAIGEAYRVHAPSLVARDQAGHWYDSPQSPFFQELRSSARFADATYEEVSWERTLSSATYVELASTYSDHSTLPDAQRARLLDAMAAVIDGQGGTVTLAYKTGLFLARAV
jgi:SAM-dependent methyltransferase